MSTTPKVIRMHERQFHYIDQAAPLISVHGTMREMDKLCVDNLHKLGKSKTNLTNKVSIPPRVYEMLQEELEKCRKLIRTFGKKYMEKMGVLSKSMEEKESSPSLSLDNPADPEMVLLVSH
jgi:hypothetical protein